MQYQITTSWLQAWGRLICLSLAVNLATDIAIATGSPTEAMRAPQGLSDTATRGALSPDTSVSLPAGVLNHLLRFYQQVISQVDGPRSNMYPTGSAYAHQVFNKHGAFLGLLLTAERLLHEGNERKVSRLIKKYGIWRIYDPVEANDWWWNSSDSWIYTPRFDPYNRR